MRKLLRRSRTAGQTPSSGGSTFYVDRRPLEDELESYRVTEEEWIAAAAVAGWSPTSDELDPAVLRNEAFPGWVVVEMNVYGDPVTEVVAELRRAPEHR